MRLHKDKIFSIKRLKERLKNKRGKLVFTNGCFDILHYGHVYYLEKARQMGDMLVVAVNSDSSVKRIKGPSRPINTLKDRMRVLAALESVDFVVSFSEETPLRAIRALRPDILVKGGDWKPEQIVGAGDVMEWGGRVLTIPVRKGRSTTSVIDKISSG